RCEQRSVLRRVGRIAGPDVRLSPAAPRFQGAPSDAGGDLRETGEVARELGDWSCTRTDRDAAAGCRAVLVWRVHAFASDAMRVLHLRDQRLRRTAGRRRYR